MTTRNKLIRPLRQAAAFARAVDEMVLRRANCSRMPKQPPKFVPRGRNRFLEVELARAVRAAKRAGGERVEVDPDTGKISVIVGGKPDEHAADDEVERWLSKQQQG
jgi:hypothetical protein